MDGVVVWLFLRLTRQALWKAAGRDGRRAWQPGEGRRGHAGREVEGRRWKGTSRARTRSARGARGTTALVMRVKVRRKTRGRPGGGGLVLGQHGIGVGLALSSIG